MRANEDEEFLWPILASVVLVAVAVTGRKGVEKAWRAGLDRPVPRQPNAPLKDAMLWAVVSGVTVACLRIMTLRGLNRIKAQYIASNET